MLKKLRENFAAFKFRMRRVPRGYMSVLFLLLTAAVIIRIATGGGHVIYNALQGRGIFPGPLLYSVLYFLRILIAGILLTFTLYSCKAYDDRARLVLLSVISSTLLLLEYKLIFGGVSLVLAITFSVLIPVFFFVSITGSREKNRGVSILLLILVILQIINLFQIISLAVCI